jgi:hypothetical protein
MVMAILSIVVSFAVMPALNYSDDRSLKVIAQQIKMTMEQARYHAILSGQRHQLEVTAQGYHIAAFQHGRWQPSSRKGLELKPLAGTTVQYNADNGKQKWHVSAIGIMSKGSLKLGLGGYELTLLVHELGPITIQEKSR